MKSATASAPAVKRPIAKCVQRFCQDTLPWLLYLVRCPAVSKPNQPRKDHVMRPGTWNALCRTLYRLVITVCLVLTSLGCMRTAEKFCGADQQTLKQNLIRLGESPVIKDDDWVNATSITIDSIEPLPASDRKAEVSFVVRWTTGVGDARTDHSGNWQANLQKAEDGRCHVMGVAVRSGDIWIKAINTDFEIK
jgi:hypothetical protein